MQPNEVILRYKLLSAGTLETDAWSTKLKVEVSTGKAE
jgi:hypothetical protein